ncbi:LLGL2 isoform 17, partial [Pan troglodytes]
RDLLLTGRVLPTGTRMARCGSGMPRVSACGCSTNSALCACSSPTRTPTRTSVPRARTSGPHSARWAPLTPTVMTPGWASRRSSSASTAATWLWQARQGRCWYWN